MLCEEIDEEIELKAPKDQYGRSWPDSEINPSEIHTQGSSAIRPTTESVAETATWTEFDPERLFLNLSLPILHTMLVRPESGGL